MGAVAFVPLVLLALVPPGAAGGVPAWARWLGRGNGVPRAVIAVGYGLGALSAALALGGPCEAWRASVRVHAEEPGVSDRARRLAEAISAIMNCGAFGGFVALVGAVWLGL